MHLLTSMHRCYSIDQARTYGNWRSCSFLPILWSHEASWRLQGDVRLWPLLTRDAHLTETNDAHYMAAGWRRRRRRHRRQKNRHARSLATGCCQRGDIWFCTFIESGNDARARIPPPPPKMPSARSGSALLKFAAPAAFFHFFYFFYNRNNNWDNNPFNIQKYKFQMMIFFLYSITDFHLTG